LSPKPSPFKKWIKPVIFVNAIIVFGAICFYVGSITSECNINKISEVHFVNPHLSNRVLDYSMDGFYFKGLQNKLKNVKPPYSKNQLENMISSVMPAIHPEKFTRVLSVDSSSYRIQIDMIHPEVSNTRYYILTPTEQYYMKPLKIIEDLKPDF